MVMARVPHGRSQTSPSSQKEKKEKKELSCASPFAKPRAASPAQTAQGPGHPPSHPRGLQLLVASSSSRSEVGLLRAWPWLALSVTGGLEGKRERRWRAIGCELRSEIGISDMSQNSKQTKIANRPAQAHLHEGCISSRVRFSVPVDVLFHVSWSLWKQT